MATKTTETVEAAQDLVPVMIIETSAGAIMVDVYDVLGVMFDISYEDAVDKFGEIEAIVFGMNSREEYLRLPQAIDGF